MRFGFGAALLVSGWLAGCSPADPALDSSRLILRNDFEGLAGWGGLQAPSLTRERAHSGHYSIKTDDGLEYSLTYAELLARLPAGPLPGKIRVSAWVYATAPGNAQLMVQLSRSLQDGSLLFDQGLPLAPAAKRPGAWRQLSQVFTLPANLSPANQLRLYVWRNGAPAPIYLDDLVVSREP